MVVYKTNWKCLITEDIYWNPEEDMAKITGPKPLNNSTTIYSCLEINKRKTDYSS